MTMSGVDLPDPDGPVQADRLLAYMQVDVLEDMNAGRAARATG